MLRIRPALAVALVVGGGLAARSQIGSDPETAAAARPDVAAALPADELQPQHVQPTTTTTTAPPPTTTTTAPPPPPTVAPPAPARVRAMAAAPAPAPVRAPAPSSAASPDSETRALQLVNDERARNGLPALRLNAGARSVARSWASYMAAHSLAHNPNLSRDLARAGVAGWRTIGENVGYGGSVDKIHAMFMGSGGHRANILSTAYSEVGIGVVSSGGQLWLTMDFVGW